MKPFVFTLRQEPAQRVDLSALSPDRIAGRAAAEIENIPVTPREGDLVTLLFHVSNNTKSGSTGTLFSAADFSSPGDRSVVNGDTLNVTYTFSLDAA